MNLFIIDDKVCIYIWSWVNTSFNDLACVGYDIIVFRKEKKKDYTTFVKVGHLNLEYSL